MRRCRVPEMPAPGKEAGHGAGRPWGAGGRRLAQETVDAAAAGAVKVGAAAGLPLRRT
jgi:hypothetical protein